MVSMLVIFTEDIEVDSEMNCISRIYRMIENHPFIKSNNIKSEYIDTTDCFLSPALERTMENATLVGLCVIDIPEEKHSDFQKAMHDIREVLDFKVIDDKENQVITEYKSIISEKHKLMETANNSSPFLYDNGEMELLHSIAIRFGFT